MDAKRLGRSILIYLLIDVSQALRWVALSSPLAINFWGSIVLCYLRSYRAKEGALVGVAVHKKWKLGLGSRGVVGAFTGHSIYCVSL
jgi:threonine/homoserine efflux transporter RhtA